MNDDEFKALVYKKRDNYYNQIKKLKAARRRLYITAAAAVVAICSALTLSLNGFNAGKSINDANDRDQHNGDNRNNCGVITKDISDQNDKSNGFPGKRGDAIGNIGNEYKTYDELYHALKSGVSGASDGEKAFLRLDELFPGVIADHSRIIGKYSYIYTVISDRENTGYTDSEYATVAVTYFPEENSTPEDHLYSGAYNILTSDADNNGFRSIDDAIAAEDQSGLNSDGWRSAALFSCGGTDYVCIFDEDGKVYSALIPVGKFLFEVYSGNGTLPQSMSGLFAPGSEANAEIISHLVKIASN
ncbi:MAG: hypothetical protein VB118_09240 [Oscillospiraceae bacterium]|nr:hypothetical protein [Oscillospiraceae bacterium]